MKKLEEQEIAAKLASLPGWEFSPAHSSGAKLQRQYQFATFERAIGFMLAAVPGIQQMDHHPEWGNVYNRVTVDLTTHSVGGVTEKDFKLAALLEDLAKRLL
jgi:4a-hydroxytetrahydrobiopterin dehydratase